MSDLINSNPLPLLDFGSKKALALEAAMKAHPAFQKHPDEVCPVQEHFSDGKVYARTIFIPKGTVLVGHIHKRENLNIMSKGVLLLLTPEGVKRVEAPYIRVSPPGTKRAAYALEDTWWTTIHGTDLTDTDEIEKVFIAKSEAEYLEYVQALALENKNKTEG